MSQGDQLPSVRSYLSELRGALSDVPREIAKEIEDGVAEELDGLSATHAMARIQELGDPVFIAAEAKASLVSDPSTVSGVPAPLAAPLPTDSGSQGSTVATTEARWYIVVASLLVAVGGNVIPVLGWIAGIAMVWMSTAWRTWEKWVGTLAPVAIAALLFGGSFLARGLAPESLTGWHLAILAVFFSPFLAGMWLLLQALRRRARS